MHRELKNYAWQKSTAQWRYGQMNWAELFLWEEVQMIKIHMKKCSTSLVIKEMHIKTMLTFYLTLVKMAIIKNANNDKCCLRCGQKRTLIHCWGEYKVVQSLWKTVWMILKKLKREFPYDPVIPLLGIHPKECKSDTHPCLLQHYSEQPIYGSSQDPFINNRWMD
jgi:hypothetical protein